MIPVRGIGALHDDALEAVADRALLLYQRLPLSGRQFQRSPGDLCLRQLVRPGGRKQRTTLGAERQVEPRALSRRDGDWRG